MIGICSFDAGGAELIASYIKQHPDNYIYCLGGPALAIFQRKLKIDTTQNLTPNELIANSLSVICSGSWQSELELDVIDLARKNELYSIVFLDHWVNFTERFCRPARESWPDEVWVADEYALEIAKNVLPPKLPIKLQQNPIRIEIEQRVISKPSVHQGLNILYVSEPTSEHAKHSFGDPNHFGYTEYEALKHTIDTLNQEKRINTFRLRSHPSEAVNKYNDILSLANFPIELSKTSELLEDLQGINVVIGATTMAMAVAIYSGKRVFTSLPRPHLKNPLPFKEITPISQLSKLAPSRL